MQIVPKGNTEAKRKVKGAYGAKGQNKMHDGDNTV